MHARIRSVWASASGFSVMLSFMGPVAELVPATVPRCPGLDHPSPGAAMSRSEIPASLRVSVSSSLFALPWRCDRRRSVSRRDIAVRVPRKGHDTRCGRGGT